MVRAGQKPGGKAEALTPLKTKGLDRRATRSPQQIAIRALVDTLYCVIVVDFRLTPGSVWVKIANGITRVDAS
jgi:hypothetical protein